jgi:hypothetical protein
MTSGMTQPINHRLSADAPGCFDWSSFAVADSLDHDALPSNVSASFSLLGHLLTPALKFYSSVISTQQFWGKRCVTAELKLMLSCMASIVKKAASQVPGLYEGKHCCTLP